MRGAGAVTFEALDGDDNRLCKLSWDAQGTLTVVTQVEQDVPRFSASTDIWNRFISGDFSAVAGVMSGMIRFKGRLSFAFRYGADFDYVGKVARRDE